MPRHSEYHKAMQIWIETKHMHKQKMGTFPLCKHPMREECKQGKSSATKHIQQIYTARIVEATTKQVVLISPIRWDLVNQPQEQNLTRPQSRKLLRKCPPGNHKPTTTWTNTEKPTVPKRTHQQSKHYTIANRGWAKTGLLLPDDV